MNHKLAAWAVTALLLCLSTAWGQSVEREGQRSDDRRPDAPFTVDLLGRSVQLGGSWEYTDERRDNFDLTSARARDRRVREHEVKLEARFAPWAGSEVFLQAVGLHETRRTQGTAGAQRSKALERGQTWIKFDRLGGTRWGLQVGRVALIERRAWWWDDDLDALRVFGSGEDWRVDTGLARELARVSSAEPTIPADRRGIVRWFGQAQWRVARRHAIDGFWLFANDRSSRPSPGSTAPNEDATDPSDLRARWLGARASGEWRGAADEQGLRLAYWADAAWLRGREAVTRYTEGGDGVFTAGSMSTRRVKGQAVDLGATLIAPLWGRPSVSVAHARGSSGFRQTGLQENKARIAGVKRVRRYGELLQPELANLAVTTLGTGIRLLDNSSLELIAHRYRQATPADSLVDARLSTDPTGLNGHLGRELDLVLALREWRHVEFTVRWSRFTPGAAFDAAHRDAAHALELGAALNF